MCLPAPRSRVSPSTGTSRSSNTLPCRHLPVEPSIRAASLRGECAGRPRCGRSEVIRDLRPQTHDFAAQPRLDPAWRPSNAGPSSGHADVSACRTALDNICGMTALTPYIHLPGTARDALTFYGDVFGCAVQLHTFQEFNRTDGPANAIAHGCLTEGPVALFAADAAGDQPPVRSEGMMLSLLGTSTPSVLRTWFSRLSEGGRIVDDLQTRPWGATDGQVIDRYGLHWLIGFEGDENH